MKLIDLYNQMQDIIDMGLGSEEITKDTNIIELLENLDIKNSNYLLYIQFYTDGDYWLDAPWLKHDDYTYTFNAGYDFVDTAEVITVLLDIEWALRCDKPRVKEDITLMLNKAIEQMETQGDIYVELGGNYEGTFIRFGENPFN